MAVHTGTARTDDRLGAPGSVRHAWWLHPALISVPVGVAALAYGFGLGEEWRGITSASPLDPGPASGLLMAVVVAGAAALAGLTLLVSISRAFGAILFAFGVGLICGVALGLVMGPDIIEQLPTVALFSSRN